jgi:hypothetical protein
MPEHQHFSHCRLVAAEQHDDQAEYPAHQRVDDLVHPPSQSSPPSSLSGTVQVNQSIEYSGGTG